mgnify:CR=1 FL=1
MHVLRRTVCTRVFTSCHGIDNISGVFVTVNKPSVAVTLMTSPDVPRQANAVKDRVVLVHLEVGVGRRLRRRVLDLLALLGEMNGAVKTSTFC